MSQSKIEWTEHTWNPVRGCSMAKGSETGGCLNCYAARQAARGLPGNRFSDGSPLAVMRDSGPRWTGRVELQPHMLDIPLRRRKPTTYFVNSMSDLYHESLPIADQERIFRVMLSAPWHTYQILTKRADLMAQRVPQIYERIMGPSQNWRVPEWIWLGVSCEDRKNLYRIDLLRQTPAAIRFLSLEPLLGNLGTLDLTNIDWVIVGGESGPGARPCDVAWMRSIVRQCAQANVACFVKQLGTNIAGYNPHGTWVNGRPHTYDRKGGDPSEWPEDLRVRQMLEVKR